MSGRDPARDRLAADLERLSSLDMAGLRRRWRRLFGNPAPAQLPRSLLHRILAYRVQADALGDLDRDTARELRRMAEEGREAEVMPLPELRPVKPGTLLVREWKGTLQRVMVLGEGLCLERGHLSQPHRRGPGHHGIELERAPLLRAAE